MASNDIRLVAQLNVREGRLDALKAAFEEAAAIAIDNPGMLSYEFYASDDGATAWALERYADSDACTGHLNGPVGSDVIPRIFAEADLAFLNLYGNVSPEAEAAFRSLAGDLLTIYRPLAGFTR
jgi:quinol monooxygenase YgiN